MENNSLFKQLASEYAITIRTTLQHFREEEDALVNVLCGGLHDFWDNLVESGGCTEETMEHFLEQKNDFLCSLGCSHRISAHIADALSYLKYRETLADLLPENQCKVAEVVADILEDWDNRFSLVRKFYQ